MKGWLVKIALATCLVSSSPAICQTDCTPCDPRCFESCCAPTWASLYGFQGFYVGFNVGFASLKSEFSDLDSYFDSVGTFSAAHTNWALGLQFGYDWRFCNKIVGLVGDWEWSRTQTRFIRFPHGAGELRVNQEMEQRLFWYATLRARAGLVLNDFLIYLTGGGAIANFNTTLTNAIFPNTLPGERFKFNQHRWGWAAGVGVEYLFWCYWSVNAELLYLRFDTSKINFTSPLRGHALKSFSIYNDVWVGRVGLNFHFSLCDFW